MSLVWELRGVLGGGGLIRRKFPNVLAFFKGNSANGSVPPVSHLRPHRYGLYCSIVNNDVLDIAAKFKTRLKKVDTLNPLENLEFGMRWRLD